jgi:site-specific recombinase XerD
MAGRSIGLGLTFLHEVRQIVDAQPTSDRRALFAVLYGTGIKVGTALRLTRADVWDARRESREG